VDGKSVVRNSLEAELSSSLHVEDSGIDGLGGQRVERVNTDDRTDWGRGSLSFSGSPVSKNSQPP